MKRDTIITIFVFYILVSMLGLFIFMAGYGNADLGQNMRYLNTRFGLDLYDVNLGGNNVTASEGYVNGMKGMYVGLAVVFAAGFIPAMYLLYESIKT